MPVREVWSWTMTATLPASPMSSAILSAASPAAARLSVVTVVTGMSLSTPESKPTTGMPAALAFSSSGVAALLSRAAKQIAAGFLSSAVCSMVSCLSTSDSDAGPSYVIVAPSFAASSVAPFWTACQNWCCEPLDTIATYGASPPAAALAAGAAGELLVPPQAATRAATAMSPAAGRMIPVSFMLLLREG